MSLIKTKICPKRGAMVSREELYELVWSMPMTKVAEKFSGSGSYMARVCSLLRVLRPERGYWAKLDVGKAPTRPESPEALPRDELFWSQKGDAPIPRIRAVTITSAPMQRRVVTVPAGFMKPINPAFICWPMDTALSYSEREQNSLKRMVSYMRFPTGELTGPGPRMPFLPHCGFAV